MVVETVVGHIVVGTMQRRLLYLNINV